jgi:hypothetical protein
MINPGPKLIRPSGSLAEDTRSDSRDLESLYPRDSTPQRVIDSTTEQPPTISPQSCPIETNKQTYSNVKPTYGITYGYDTGQKDADVSLSSEPTFILPLIRNEVNSLYSNQGPVLLGSRYFEKMVPITVPTSLLLSSTLSENSMNLLYFHHFINHTARLLVAHDCERNPFRTLLPRSQLFCLLT